VKAFVIDVTRCNGCYQCQIGCKDEHCGNDWSPYAKPQPDTGQFWGKTNEYVRGNLPHVRMSYVFVPCQHCADAPCIAACEPGAISTRDDGLVIIDPAKCTGCMNCVDACPYGAIYYNKDLNLAQKCTGCAHLLDGNRPIQAPRCVDNCPTGAIKFGEEADLQDLIAKAEVLNPEYGTKPRVHYIGLPTKRFIAGTVYDPVAQEVVMGATCTLSGAGSATVETNHWGDFWFEGLEEGTYSLQIEANGKTKTIADISTKKDVGLGDIPLS
jgi:tetrathionate reductase subunit B